MSDELLKYINLGDTHARDVSIVLQENPSLANTCNEQQRTPLMEASRQGFSRIAEVLISYGANVNAADCIGSTALWEAATQRHEEVVRVLLEGGAQGAKALLESEFVFSEAIKSMLVSPPATRKFVKIDFDE
eukprot:PhF_6_TR10086/c0_g1_i1/m.15705